MVPVQRAAVPAVVSELVLALSDPLLGSLPDGLHQVWVPLAELPLLVHQAGNVVADHPSSQRSDVPDDKDSTNSADHDELKGQFNSVFHTKTTCKGCLSHCQGPLSLCRSEKITLDDLSLCGIQIMSAQWKQWETPALKQKSCEMNWISCISVNVQFCLGFAVSSNGCAAVLPLV